MTIYSFIVTSQEFEKTNRLLSEALGLPYQHIECETTTFYANKIGRGGATKGTTGYKYTEEQRQNISKSLKGKTSSRLGKKHTEETKNKIAQSKIGVKLSEEIKEKMKLDGRRGRKHTKKTKDKMRELALKREEQKRLLKS
jgi:hypothetical protein